MSPPLLGVGGQGQCNAFLMGSPASPDSDSPKESGLRERNYLGLSDCSSVDSSSVSASPEENKSCLNLKATELRLSLPGSQSPEHESDFNLFSLVKHDEKPLFPLAPSKDVICYSSQKQIVSGNKRGFSDTVDGLAEPRNAIFSDGKWIFGVGASDAGHAKLTGNLMSNGSCATPATVETDLDASQDGNDKINYSSTNAAPAAKAQMVGWPPIRSFWKNTLGTTSKNNDKVDGKPGAGSLFVKVSMDGAPYLRKVDLRMYSAYQDLSSALEKMFSCYITGQYVSPEAPNREMLTESKSRDLHGSEYVLTYEDKDGDWMLVGDVPWEMFIASCKRLKIMKGSDAIGLAPGSMEKAKNRT